MEVRGADRYQPDKLAAFEKNVDEQVASSQYSLEVNLAVLRLYQLQPSTAKKQVIAKILLKALMQLPKPDYKTCTHVLPEKLQLEEPVATIVLLAQHLETSRFQDFWALAGSCRDTLNSVPGFHEAIRGFILHTLSITFQRVTKQTLGECLQLQGAALDAFLADKAKSSGWSVTGNVVVLPRNPFNTAVQKRTQETVRFDAVAPVLRASA